MARAKAAAVASLHRPRPSRRIRIGRKQQAREPAEPLQRQQPAQGQNLGQQGGAVGEPD